MFDLDRWREIFQSINKNKLRSIMSGFTVAFAILLFTLLFGVVSGLKNTFEGAFVDNAVNSMIVRVWKTTKPFNGLQSGRRIQLKNPDYDYIAEKYDSKIDLMTARIFKNFSISYKNKQDNYSITAVHPDHQFLEKTIITEGRYINQLDINESSKVIVIGDKISLNKVSFAEIKIQIPDLHYDFKALLSPILMAIPAQLLAYHVARERGTDVDQPRNLAKSVTVE